MDLNLVVQVPEQVSRITGRFSISCYEALALMGRLIAKNQHLSQWLAG